MSEYELFLYEEFPQLLQKLEDNQVAKWGKMNVHQMVEHLAQVISISNGRFTATANADVERLTYRKTRFFEQEYPFPRGFRVEMVSEEPIPPMFPQFDQSKEFLLNQLQRFLDYHSEHPDLTPVHPVFGAMNYNEWVEFQSRHIKHHFQQFGILKEDFTIRVLEKK